MSAKHTKPLSTGAELTFNLVAVNVELFQIHEFAELLRQLSCKKSDHINTKLEALRPEAELTSDRIARDIERLQIDKVTELLGKAAYRKMAIISTKLPAQHGCCADLSVSNSRGRVL